VEAVSRLVGALALALLVMSNVGGGCFGLYLRERGELNRAQTQLERERNADASAAARAKRVYRPVPGSSTTADHGPPWNVHIVCVTTGSVRNGAAPLDLNVGPRPGDMYVRTCRGYPLKKGPVG
jgi:hypothetical protein